MKSWIRMLSLLAVLLLFCTGCAPDIPPAVTTGPAVTDPSQTTAPETTAPATQPSLPPWHTDPPGQQEAPVASYVLSFAGDCTFGDNYDEENGSGTFCTVVKDRYDYPLQGVKDIFFNDDYSLVNLECALTAADATEEEMEELKDHTYRFRGPAEYAKILVQGGVEFASCANNHSKDYGKQGLYDTWNALKAENIDFASFARSCVATTKSGLKLGIFSVFFNTNQSSLEYNVKHLRDQGAEIIIMSIHWGDEGTYFPIEYQVALGRLAIDCGVDIVFGHHSHTLMPVESYHGGVIYYSLGNFSFGGNRNPGDKDTAILQQQILRMADGTVKLGSLTVIPCRVSSLETWNDYQPTLYTEEDPGYQRVIDKLAGTFEDYRVSQPEPDK